MNARSWQKGIPPAVPPNLGHAILDRLVHNAHRLQLTGESMRKQTARDQTLTQTPDPITLSVEGAIHDRAKFMLTVALIIARNRHSQSTECAANMRATSIACLYPSKPIPLNPISD